MCVVSTANSHLIHRKYSVIEFILSTTNWQVMLRGIFDRWSSGRCHTCHEVFVINQIIISKQIYQCSISLRGPFLLLSNFQFGGYGGGGVFPLRYKSTGSEADFSPPCSGRVKNAWSYTSTTSWRGAKLWTGAMLRIVGRNLQIIVVHHATIKNYLFRTLIYNISKLNSHLSHNSLFPSQLQTVTS